MIADKDNRLLGGFAQSQLIDVVLNGLHGEHILIEYDIFGVEILLVMRAWFHPTIVMRIHAIAC